MDNEDLREQIKLRESQLLVFRENLVSVALSLIGAPTRKYDSPDNGMTPDGGFDCSGFVNYVAKIAAEKSDFPLQMPRHSREIFREVGEFADYDFRDRGDLIFFERHNRVSQWIGHIGIILSPTEFMHSPGLDNREITISTIPDTPHKLGKVSEHQLYRYHETIKKFSLPIGDHGFTVS